MLNVLNYIFAKKNLEKSGKRWINIFGARTEMGEKGPGEINSEPATSTALDTTTSQNMEKTGKKIKLLLR